MIRYLLDTDLVSELRLSRPNRGVETRFALHRHACGIPAPVIEELQFGISRLRSAERKEQMQKWLESFLADFPVLPFDGYCAQWLGRERARLTDAGEPPAFQDALIASIAVVNELILVTHNTADFRGFADIELQDWMKS